MAISVVFALVFGACVAELFLAQKLPALLAVLARIPLGPERTIPLTPSAARALGTPSELVGYREGAPASIDLAKLGGPRVVKRWDDLAIFFFLERGLLVARRGFGWQKKQRPLVRVDVRAEPDRLVVRSGFYPPTLIAMLLFVATIGFLRSTFPALFMIGFAAIFSVVACLTALGPAKSHLVDAVAELEARLATLEQTPQVLHRVADTAPEALPADDDESEAAQSRRAS
jgi:hypothetical protein